MVPPGTGSMSVTVGVPPHPQLSASAVMEVITPLTGWVPGAPGSHSEILIVAPTTTPPTGAHLPVHASCAETRLESTAGADHATAPPIATFRRAERRSIPADVASACSVI